MEIEERVNRGQADDAPLSLKIFISSSFPYTFVLNNSDRLEDYVFHN